MDLPYRFCLLASVIVELVGLLVFMKGFFPIKHAVPGHATRNDTVCLPSHVCFSNVPAKFDRMVFVLIDALRADFVLPTEHSDLPQMGFVGRQIARNETYSYLAWAHPPTVTMPRLKAITTGGIPGFIDVVLNFDSKALSEDNFVYQLRAHARRMVFYGDDTWLRLFPGYFVRSDGTTSFFVTDYTEVDANVTRHIDGEMRRDDWDVLFLHYLGLDHIGHLAGPKSPLVSPKLAEMDGVMEKLYAEIARHDDERGTSTLLLLCGDHGMSDQGSHGGATSSETGTPLVLMSPRFSNGRGAHYTTREIHQIDLAPTLSLLLGLPVPQNSLGVTMTSLDAIWDPNETLLGLYVNSQQILEVLKGNVDDFEREESYQLYARAVKSHVEWASQTDDYSLDTVYMAQKVSTLYHKALVSMRDRVAGSLSTYDIHAMAVGVLLLWLNCVAFLRQLSNIRAGQSIEINLCWSLRTGIPLCMVCIACMLHVTACTGSLGSELLCQSTFPQCLIPLAVGLCLIWTMAIFTNNHSLYLPFNATCISSLFIWAGTVVHTLTLLASSFVEEEHQTWYFLTTSVILVLAAGRGRAAGNITQSELAEAEPEKAAGRLERPGLARAEVGGVLTRAEVGGVLVFLASHRVCRAWNRTGDKWAHLPDVGDWLVEPGHKPHLSAAVLVSLCVVQRVARGELSDRTSRLLFLLGSVGVYLFRAANAAVLCPIIYEGGVAGKGVTEAWFVYSLVAVLLIKVALSQARVTDINTNRGTTLNAHQLYIYTNLHYIWVMLMLLLMRPHNIVLVALLLVQHRAIHVYLRRLLPADPVALALLFAWFGQASFYFQGNSNSIATVDVSAGYVGLDSYYPAVIGLLMACATYAGPTFWALSLVSLLAERDAPLKRSLSPALFATLLSRALPVAVYVILVSIERHHLFVWSVFSPKLLYEGMTTLIISLVCVIFSFLVKI